MFITIGYAAACVCAALSAIAGSPPERIALLALAFFFGLGNTILLARVSERVELEYIGWIFFVLTVVASFAGPALFAYKVGPLTLFPFRILIAVSLMLLALRWLARDCLLPDGAKKTFPYLLFLSFWLVWGSAATLWARDVNSAISSISNLAIGLLFVILGAFYLTSENRIRVALDIWTILAVVVAGFSVFESVTGRHLPVSAYYGLPDPRYARVPTGVFRNPNDLAFVMSISFPIFVVSTLNARGLVRSLVSTAGIALAAYVITLTGSRANLLALAIEMVVLLVVLSTSKINRRETALIISAPAVMIAPLALSRDVLVFLSRSARRFITFTLQAGRVSEVARLNLIKNSLQYLFLTYGFGVGPGNAEVWMKNAQTFYTFGIINVHNWWFEVLVEFGIIVYLGYLAFYAILALKLLAVALDASTPLSRYSLALFVSLIGFSIGSISSSSIMSIPGHWLLFAVCLGTIVCYSQEGA
jgi:teichuronic acid biosynthesis protein TuaE